MPEITAKMVNELRAKTGLGMMECKKALTASEGDVEKAIDDLRKKGVKTSITERAANEGRVGAAISADKKTGVIVEINCNTDFTAKSDPVGQIIDAAAAKLLSATASTLSDDPEIKSRLTTVSQQTGENVVLGRSAVLTSPGGQIGAYLYTVGGKGKVAVLVDVTGNVTDDVIKNLGMHIVAAKPVALTRDQVPADLVAREKEIAVEQAKASGKPQNIAEKIADGKMNAFYGERVLLDQEYINGEVFKGPVKEYLKARGVTLNKYVRLEVGQA
jgi:elongation factor Ts